MTSENDMKFTCQGPLSDIGTPTRLSMVAAFPLRRQSCAVAAETRGPTG